MRTKGHRAASGAKLHKLGYYGEISPDLIGFPSPFPYELEKVIEARERGKQPAPPAPSPTFLTPLYSHEI